MTQASLLAKLQQEQQQLSEVPSPQNGHRNRHRPLSSTNDAAPPPVPPRTYSQKGHMNGQVPSVNRYMPVAKPTRRYRLEEFNFLKLLGKGSFGKVCNEDLVLTIFYFIKNNFQVLHTYVKANQRHKAVALVSSMS